VRLALWFTSWARGGVSLDHARDGVVGADAAHDVYDAGSDPEPVPLILALGRLRARGAGAATPALPVPGDPLGLGGPPSFNAEALEAGEAVLLEGTALGLVPRRAGAGVVWTVHPAEPPRHLPSVAEADAELRHAVLRTASALADLDVARWRPEVADELTGLRGAEDLALPPTVGPRAVRLLAFGVRCRRIVDLALADDGASITANEADARRAALQPLDHAARRAVVAACAPGPGR
jgi:hypothetical protein